MTEPRGPVKVGDLLEETVGDLYHRQMLAEYVQASEQITLNAMVMLSLVARRFDDRVKFVILSESDQGDWMDAAGLASALPVLPGDFSMEGDLNPDGMFDDEGWASSLDDRTSHIWEPFTVASPPLPYWWFLDVDKVLAEVALPWRTPGAGLVCGFHDRPTPCLECA